MQLTALTGSVTSIGDPAPGGAKPVNDQAADGSAHDRRVKSAREFEAYLLQTVVDQLLPRDDTSVFGSGLSASYWRSMMAERIAVKLSSHLDLGIARHMVLKP